MKLNSVLLVDDDEATNFINRRIIEKAGIANHIEVAYNGKEALDYLSCSGKYEKAGAQFPKPMLILMDINMPVMDGWEFLDAYRKLDDDKKSDKILVMLTTSFNPDDKIKAENIAEISGFQSKPLDQAKVSHIMDTYFGDSD
ncbi:MAG: CheY-like chemotaxis protein [Flavobacterium sp.]|jgi:CheY-like chemotaxis protein